MKRLIPLIVLLGLLSCTQQQSVEYTIAPEGGIRSIRISGDKSGMDWILAPDGSQFEWIGPEYEWGLGRLKVDGEQRAWTKGTCMGEDSVFDLGDGLTLMVSRSREDGDLLERYIINNQGEKTHELSEIEVNTPFNDNYPDAETCLTNRCHAHIWAAGTGSYVCAIRMGAEAPHLGLVLTEGSLEGYAIRERSREKGMSNTRGVICLCPEDKSLSPGESYSFAWRLFVHAGKDDFARKMVKKGGIWLSADKYVAQVGDTVKVSSETRKSRNTAEYVIAMSGDNRISIPWNGGETYVEVLGISSLDSLVGKRAEFVLTHQQYSKRGDPRDGAFLPYDNTADVQYHEWEQPNSWSDANEGRERLGEGIFLAYLYKRNHDPKILAALQKYAKFVRTKLQDKNFDTWSDVDKDKSRIAQPTQRNRIYNYPWVAHFYLEMFEATGEKKYLKWAYGTMTACYRNGGYDFYAIDVPVSQSIKLLKDNGMDSEAESLLGEYRKAAEHYMANGVEFPKSEVNYEQSIVAPATGFLIEMYLVTKEKEYLDAASSMMPVLEAFNGIQPSSHLHDMAIRHWDGYWFGLPRQWGDTFPHYWSCITADVFANYSIATSDNSYLERAKAILKGNLSLFTEEGRAGAAYIYPLRVDGIPAHGLNPMANDQDFALAYLLKWME